MSREIKFRIWWKDIKTMLYPGHGTLDSMTLGYLRTERFNDQYDLMQFTGLYDKEGRELYEGDIVVHENPPVEYEEVYWNEKEACFACRGGEHESWIDGGHEIIGNIYENSEMVETND